MSPSTPNIVWTPTAAELERLVAMLNAENVRTLLLIGGNGSMRGAAPWDAIVFKFAPGFENLPPPKDKKKVEAAGR